MKKIAFVMALVMLLGCILASCGGRKYKAFKVDPNYQSQSTGNTTNTVTDFNGDKITLPKDISSIVCFSPEAALVVRSAGAAKLITAIDEETTNVSSVKNVITIDDLASAEADIIFINDTYDVEGVLDGSTPYVVVPSTMTIHDVETLVTIVETAISSERDSMNTQIEQQISIASGGTSEFPTKYRAFIDLGDFNTVGGGNYLSEILSICGCENVFADKEGKFQITEDQLKEANPDFIFTMSTKAVYRNLRDLDCVKEDRVFTIFQNEPYKLNYASNFIEEVISTIYGKVMEYRAGTQS